MTSISGWVIQTPDFRNPTEVNPAALIGKRSAYPSELWRDAAQEQVLRDIGCLRDDWDGSGASHIDALAISNAKALLYAFRTMDNQPDFIFPNPAGTVEFEWEGPFGTANLEIGNTTFGFYTAPIVGESIMAGGSFEVVDADEIGFALETIHSSAVARSVANFNQPLGFPRWYAPRAA
jgi:hypothetical protein